MRRHEREYSNATASRSPAHLFTNVDGLDPLEVWRDRSVLVGPATSYWIQETTQSSPRRRWHLRPIDGTSRTQPTARRKPGSRRSDRAREVTTWQGAHPAVEP